MYYYIYDSFVGKKKYERTRAQIETRLTDLGISGRIGRLTILTNFKELVKNGMNKGAKTIVLVGNDETVSRALNSLADQKVTLGIIPIGDLSDNKIARILGIPPTKPACDILANRIIKKIDLGRINRNYFLCSAQLTANNLTIECGKKFSINALKSNNQINIYNLPLLAENQLPIKNLASTPLDGILEAVITPRFNPIVRLFKKTRPQQSLFPIKKITIHNDKKTSILLDGCKIVDTPAIVEVVPQKLKVIVGKERMF